LKQVSDKQFHELSLDCFEEMLRRRVELAGGDCPMYLERNPQYTKRHNEARKRLHAIPTIRFRELIHDCYTEMVRRHPNIVRETDQAFSGPDDPAISPNTSSEMSTVSENDRSTTRHRSQANSPSGSTRRKFIEDAQSLVNSIFKSKKSDPSRDLHHVERVRRLAMVIADENDSEVDKVVVEVAAVLHDIGPNEDLSNFLERNRSILGGERSKLIKRIVDHCSWQNDVKRRNDEKEHTWHRTCLELHCVQDADKLDAMGAIGVLRCAANCGLSRSVLYQRNGDGQDWDEDDEGSTRMFSNANQSRPGTCGYKLSDELLQLQTTMKTDKGRKMADKRHKFLQRFVWELSREMDECS